MDLISAPFGIGIFVALLVALAVAVQAALARSAQRLEILALRDHLQRQMEITSTGQRTLTEDLGELRRQNENLRITNATLRQKPGRAELRSLEVQDRALRLMQARVPGFAPAWEMALQEAADEFARTERGLLPLIRRVFRPALPARSTPPQPAKSGSRDGGDDGG
jgi:hypothetical protein